MTFVRFAIPLAAYVVICSQVFASDVIDITFTIRNAGTAVFSHDKHLNAPSIKDNCLVCHEKIYRNKSKRPVTMAEMEKGKSCGACHGRSAFSLKACGRCHEIKDVIFVVKPTGDVTFSHTPHTRKRGCGDCHPRLFKTGRNRPVTMATMEKGKSCGACHNGRTAFAMGNCSRCHRASDILMKVNGAGPVNFSHTFHINIYKCADCHPGIFRLGYTRERVTMYDMEKGKSCGACHDDKTAFTIREDCVRCHDM